MFYNINGAVYSVSGVYALRGRPIRLTEKSRDYSVLSLRIKGNTTFYCAEKTLKALDGTVTYIPKNVGYSRVTEDNEEMVVIRISVFGDDISEIKTFDSCQELQPFFETALREWERGSAVRYERCMVQLYRILETLHMKSHDSISEPPSAIKAGVMHLQTSFRDPELTVEKLASLSCVSSTYFRKIYKAHYGVAPIKALTELRFTYAKELLASGYYTVTETALSSGFSDTKYFRTAFKAKYGITPNEYIKEHNR